MLQVKMGLLDLWSRLLGQHTEAGRDWISCCVMEVMAHFKLISRQPCICEGSHCQCNMYRRGARRWRKLFKVNGHLFQAKRFSRRSFCAFCSDRIWGLGKQGYKCINCKLLVHKKCHKLIQLSCDSTVDPSALPDDNRCSHTFIPSQNGHASTSDESPDLRPRRRSLTPKLSSKSRHRRSSAVIGLEEFDLLRVLGRGSYAKVMLVEHRKSKKTYAMKIIKKEVFHDEEDIDWVQTEKHVFEMGSSHPFLVGLHSCFQTPSSLFFVIEFVNGGDLMYYMQQNKRLPEDQVRFYAAEICLAINFLHENGIIYRDLKLDNVLLDAEGHVKLTDYGMCKEGLARGEMTSTFCGTPNYIAPEMLRGQDYNFSVDWWALGVLMFEMLAGRSPFDIIGQTDNPDQNTEDYLFQVILEKTIRIPRSLSVKAASVLKGFLNKTPSERLGCDAETGFNDIRIHPFFRPINWDELYDRQVTPPYRPPLSSERDLVHFDPQFTKETATLTPDDPKTLSRIDQGEFDGFDYINPILVSVEHRV